MMVIDNATRECFLVNNLERHAFLLPSLLASWRLSDVGGSGNEEVRLVDSLEAAARITMNGRCLLLVICRVVGLGVVDGGIDFK
jgi:hypothetical protein